MIDALNIKNMNLLNAGLFRESLQRNGVVLVVYVNYIVFLDIPKFYIPGVSLPSDFEWCKTFYMPDGVAIDIDLCFQMLLEWFENPNAVTTHTTDVDLSFQTYFLYRSGALKPFFRGMEFAWSKNVFSGRTPKIGLIKSYFEMIADSSSEKALILSEIWQIRQHIGAVEGEGTYNEVVRLTSKKRLKK